MTDSPFSKPQITNGIFMVVGQLAVNWGHLEFSLKALSSVIYGDFGGKDVEPELPQEFVRRTRFIRDWLTKAPNELIEVVPQLKTLLDRVANLNQYRDDVIHGYLSAFDERTGKITFVVLSRTPGKDFHIAKERSVTGMQLLEIGVQAGEIGHQITNITAGLLAISSGPDEAKDFLGKL